MCISPVTMCCTRIIITYSQILTQLVTLTHVHQQISYPFISSRTSGRKLVSPKEVVVLHEDSQQHMPFEAKVNVLLDYQGISVKDAVYLRSNLGAGGEPCLLGTNVVIPLGLMTSALGAKAHDIDECLQRPMVQLVQANRLYGGSAA